jgi:hypothetical protein
MTTDNSRFLREASARRTAAATARVTAVLDELERTGAACSYLGVASAAHVSRNWLYTTPALRARVDDLRGRPAPPGRDPSAASDGSKEALLRLAREEVRRLTAENQQLRKQIAALLGEVRRHAEAERT